MKKDKFVWIGAEGVARNGKTLKPGQTYQAADFPEAVVAEWIKTGHAKANDPLIVLAKPAGKTEPTKGHE